MTRVRAAYTDLQRHAGVPFVRAWELLAPETFALHHWPFAVNFFSYIDFRRAPAATGTPSGTRGCMSTHPRHTRSATR